jgi:L-ascorbate metabolism protein UlaG (beta-lactamase superfamily)
MKITKFVHSCLLVEMPEPTSRTVLFDPGSMSRDMLEKHDLQYLDDIVITHNHGDHMDIALIKELVQKFPGVRILATAQAIDQLKEQGIEATDVAPEGMQLFDAPHAPLEPMGVTPQEHGVHYLEKLTHPGDSHTFSETMPVLALPVQAPWGSTIAALKLALELRPQYVIPIHDMHRKEQAQAVMYQNLQNVFKTNGITFIKPVDGEPFVLDI